MRSLNDACSFLDAGSNNYIGRAPSAYMPESHVHRNGSHRGTIWETLSTTHRSDTYGWAGWIHWETSGAHFYAWDQPLLFFSVDIYTCKAFSPHRAVGFTQHFFKASDVTAKEF